MKNKVCFQHVACFCMTVLVVLGSSTLLRAEQTKLHGAILYLDNHFMYNYSGGDIWSTTWADDDNLYCMSDDTGGFYGGACSNTAFHRLEGNDPFMLKGITVNPMTEYGKAGSAIPDPPETGHTWKGTSLTCVDGVLYMFMTRQKYALGLTSWDASILMSKDHGVTWTRPMMENYNNPTFPGRPFGAPAFIEYGKNGQASVHNADKYVYAISNDGYWNHGDIMNLGRVLRTKIMDLKGSNWEFYKGNGASGMDDARWTPDIEKATPILKDKGKLSVATVTWTPGLKTYVMQQWRFPDLKWDGTDRGFRASLFEFYQAPTPWGPWEKFYTSPLFTQANILGMYNPCIPTKFISSDGRDVVLFANGRFSSEDYKLIVIPCRFLTDPVDNQLKVVGVDQTTQGDWQGKYGTKGYELPSFTLPHLSALPSYARVVYTRAKRTMLSAAPQDHSKLVIPSAKKSNDKESTSTDGAFPEISSPPQRNGAYYYGQDMIIDVYIGQGLEHDCSIYVVDDSLYDDLYGPRQMRVDALDGDTDKIIDSRIVKDFAKGMYIKYNVKGHIKFRLTKLKGSEAVFSGLFFD